MTKTIAIIGAGPGIGLALAQRFGREGFQVALLSRNKEKLNQLVTRLGQEGITAQAFSADVTDPRGLTQALQEVINTWGSIDVLEYSPSPAPDAIRNMATLDTESVQKQVGFSVLGAITAVQTVLPAMQARREGTLLFTTAVSAQHPLDLTASFGIAAGAQLNYVRLLHDTQKAHNIFAGLVAIAALVIPEGESGDQLKARFPKQIPIITPDVVANQHWALYTERNRCEAIVGDVESLLATQRPQV